MADELIEGDNTFDQAGTTDDETSINQRPTHTTDATTTKTRNLINFHLKKNVSITFDSNYKIADKKQLPRKLKILSQTLQFDKKHKTLSAPVAFYLQKLRNSGHRRTQKCNVRIGTGYNNSHTLGSGTEMPARGLKIQTANGNLLKVKKQCSDGLF